MGREDLRCDSASRFFFAIPPLIMAIFSIGSTESNTGLNEMEKVDYGYI